MHPRPPKPAPSAATPSSLSSPSSPRTSPPSPAAPPTTIDRTARTRRGYSRLALFVLASALATACDDDDATTTAPVIPPDGQVVLAGGAIDSAVTAFRALLGEPRNGGAVPPAAGGRREVNWDGVPPRFDNIDSGLPSDFFNTTVPLGAVMLAPGGTRNDSSRFADIEPTNRSEFVPFSAPKLFAPTAGNVVEVRFRIPGRTTPATVRGFGAVFADVDLAGRTTLDVRDVRDRRIALLVVPPRTAGASSSFAGVVFPTAMVAAVRITLGTGALEPRRRDLSQGGRHDLVVLDDFLYAEPVAIP